jgi:signal transduction histidine kinase/CheY-like chemotaxis protein
MPSPADASSLTVLLGRAAVHQDLLWFAVLVGWSLVFVLWWRHPQRRSIGPLMPWIAVARVLGAMVQFLAFNPPFDLFLERLVPGTNASYLPATLDPNLTADLVLAALMYGVFFVWWQQDASTRAVRLFRRWTGLFMLAGLVPIHWAWPHVSSWLLALIPVLPAWRLLRSRAEHGSSLPVYLLPALVPALSTVGPVAYHGGMLQRLAPSTPMGVVAAVFQIALSALLIGYLWRKRPQSTAAADRRAAWKVARPFLLTAVLIGITGLGFALATGQDNRREVLNGRLRTTVYHAGLLDPADFAVFTSESFQLADIQVAPDGSGIARAPGFAAEIHHASQALGARMRATQFQAAAHFIVVRDGWVIEVASTLPRAHPDQVVLRHRARPGEWSTWREAQPHLRFSTVPEQGAPYFCRAPVLDAAGQMLGWLEYPRAEFYSSMARKWRTGPLLVTALGLVLTAALYFQRRANQEQERALRAAAVEAEANQLKTAFLAKVSHELRTPIQSLLGYGHLLQSRLGEDPQARAWLEALQQHGEIMTRLINDLLDLSATQSGSFRLMPRVVDPRRLVEGIVSSLEPRARVRGLRLRCSITPAVPAWVEADGDRLGQVVINLTGNALKFTDAGEVTVTLDAAPEPDGRVQLALHVRDTGPGIDPAEQARLFEPFSRLDRTAAKEGSGLGLALSAVLCRAMGGGLRVESDGVNGSLFVAEFRVTRTAAAPKSQAAGASAPAVLVVDDNTLVRELFVSFLREHGCSCASATTAAEALALAEQHSPGVIVLDLSLPDGDGISLLPALRKTVPAARIIGVSAHASGLERERALAAGMADFFTKPVALETLWTAISGGSLDPARARDFLAAPELLAAFRRELPVLRAELAAAVAEGDWPRVRRRAHYVRNSALVVDARDLLDASTTLESAAERGASVADAWQRCETVMTKWLTAPS